MKVSKTIEIKKYQGSGDMCASCHETIRSGSKYLELKEDQGEEGKVIYKAGKYHFHCLAKRKYFIAYIDILGFKKLTQNLPMDKVYEVIEDLFAAAKASKVEGSIGRERKFLSDIPYLVISDAIILYQEVIPLFDTDDEFIWKEEAFGEFLLGLEGLLKEAFRRDIHLRGGISFGECIISFFSNTESNFQEHILIGKPYIEAVDMEKIQSWMGVAFHPSMNNYLQESSYREVLVVYEIPIKRKFRSRGIPKLTIGWVDMSLENERKNFNHWHTDNRREKLEEE